MMILDRYIASSYLKGMVPVMLLLLALFSFMALSEELEDVGKGTFRLIDAFMVVLYTAPRRMVDLMPVTALLGGLMGLGALANHQELIAARGAGMSTGANGKTGFSGRHDRGGAGGVAAGAAHSRQREGGVRIAFKIARGDFIRRGRQAGVLDAKRRKFRARQRCVVRSDSGRR